MADESETWQEQDEEEVDDDDEEVEEEEEQGVLSEEEQVLKMAQRGEFRHLEKLFDEAGEEKTKRLLAYQDDDGYTALHRAAYNGRLRTIRLLLHRGAKVDARTNDGWQPLHCATRWNQVEAMELLLQTGADVNAATNGSLTPLLLASSRPDCKEATAHLLLRSDVDLDHKTPNDETAADELRRSFYGGLSELMHPSLCHTTEFFAKANLPNPTA